MVTHLFPLALPYVINYYSCELDVSRCRRLIVKALVSFIGELQIIHHALSSGLATCEGFARHRHHSRMREVSFDDALSLP